MSVDPAMIAFLATIAMILVQSVKGLFSEQAQRFIPVCLLIVMSAIGALLALYQGSDVVSGVFEGFLAGASAVGLYEAGAVLPGTSRLLSSEGWIRREG